MASKEVGQKVTEKFIDNFLQLEGGGSIQPLSPFLVYKEISLGYCITTAQIFGNILLQEAAGNYAGDLLADTSPVQFVTVLWAKWTSWLCTLLPCSIFFARVVYLDFTGNQSVRLEPSSIGHKPSI